MLNPFSQSAELDNYCNLELYGTEENGYFLKLIILKNPNNILQKVQAVKSECPVNDNKFESSITRARMKFFELAYCNNWDYFITVTLDGSKYNRFDLQKFHKDFTTFLYEFKRRKYKIDFLIIPEKHLSGAWHFHGLLRGLPPSELHQYRIGEKMSSEMAYLIKSGRSIYQWPSISDKFGFNTLEPIQNKEAVTKYVTKYVTKDISRSVSEVGAHLYYHSRGLNQKKSIKQGSICKGVDLSPLYYSENDNCIIKEFAYSEENLSKILDIFTK